MLTKLKGWSLINLITKFNSNFVTAHAQSFKTRDFSLWRTLSLPLLFPLFSFSLYVLSSCLVRLPSKPICASLDFEFDQRNRQRNGRERWERSWTRRAQHCQSIFRQSIHRLSTLRHLLAIGFNFRNWVEHELLDQRNWALFFLCETEFLRLFLLLLWILYCRKSFNCR